MTDIERALMAGRGKPLHHRIFSQISQEILSPTKYVVASREARRDAPGL